jgi:hypothetical protein
VVWLTSVLPIPRIRPYLGCTGRQIFPTAPMVSEQVCEPQAVRASMGESAMEAARARPGAPGRPDGG